MNSNNTLIKEADGILFLQYPNLCMLPHIRHAASTRVGGVTDTPHLASMNLGVNTGDTRENLMENYARFCKAVEIPAEDLVFSSQFHNANIRDVTQSDRGKGLINPMDYQDVDGLVTDCLDTALTVFSADCVPILFADTLRRAIGAAHCGWGGTIKNLAGKMVETLHARYACRPEDLQIAIGASIHRCCYEVSKELYEQFLHTFPFLQNTEAVLLEHGSYYLDLPDINRQILMEHGVPKSSIFVSDLCTCCNKDTLFSHRGSAGKRGIMANIITMCR